jgi:hypothetical protein
MTKDTDIGIQVTTFVISSIDRRCTVYTVSGFCIFEYEFLNVILVGNDVARFWSHYNCVLYRATTSLEDDGRKWRWQFQRPPDHGFPSQYVQHGLNAEKKEAIGEREFRHTVRHVPSTISLYRIFDMSKYTSSILFWQVQLTAFQQNPGLTLISAAKGVFRTGITQNGLKHKNFRTEAVLSKSKSSFLFFVGILCIVHCLEFLSPLRLLPSPLPACPPPHSRSSQWG